MRYWYFTWEIRFRTQSEIIMPITLKDNNTTHKINLKICVVNKGVWRFPALTQGQRYLFNYNIHEWVLSWTLQHEQISAGSSKSCELLLSAVSYNVCSINLFLCNLKLRHNSREWQKSWAEFPQWLGFHGQPGGCLPQHLACCCQSARDRIQCSKTHFQTPCWELHCF